MLRRERIFPGSIEADPLAAALFQHLIFMGNLHAQSIDQSDIVLFPGVYGTAQHLKALDLTAQLPGQLFREPGLRLAGAKTEPLNLKHR